MYFMSRGARYRKDTTSRIKLFDEKFIYSLVTVISVSICIISVIVALTIAEQFRIYKETTEDLTTRPISQRSTLLNITSPLQLQTLISLNNISDTEISNKEEEAKPAPKAIVATANEPIVEIGTNETTEEIVIEPDSIEETPKEPDKVLPKYPKEISGEILEKSNLTADEINFLIDAMTKKRNVYDESKLRGMGEVFFEVEKEHSINVLYLLSMMGVESYFGTSEAAISLNNVAGVYDDSSLREYDDIPEAIRHLGNLLDKYYISKGRDTLPKIADLYSGLNDDLTARWVREVEYIKAEFMDLFETQLNKGP